MHTGYELRLKMVRRNSLPFQHALCIGRKAGGGAKGTTALVFLKRVALLQLSSLDFKTRYLRMNGKWGHESTPFPFNVENLDSHCTSKFSRSQSCCAPLTSLEGGSVFLSLGTRQASVFTHASVTVLHRGPTRFVP